MFLIKEFILFLLHIFKSRKLIYNLIVYDFKKNYLGSYLGLAWAFIQPLSFVLIIWVVFGLGFRAQPTTSGAPFVIWLLAGMVPWFFFSGAISSGSTAITGNAYLIRKIFFRISILPLVKIGSSFLIHLGLLIFLVVALLLNGFWPTIYWLQLPFYGALTIFFVIGLSWFTGSVHVFVKDVSSIIGILIQMGFWLTPIFWSLDLVPVKFHYLIKLNPAYFIVDGYRDSLISQIWFWEKPTWTIYYLAISSITLIFGALVFQRLRPHFADVL